jgi:hypothetical protein
MNEVEGNSALATSQPSGISAGVEATVSAVDQKLNIERSHVVDASPTIRVVDEGGAENSVNTPPPLTPNWYYADGVGGKGEKPEWFNEGTFKTVEEQAKAQNEARKKLGQFSGAPEDGYELSLGEENQDIIVDESDALLNKFANIASELNMSQDGFNQILGMYFEEMKGYANQEEEQNQEYWKEEMKKLGPNGAEELKILKQWSRNALPEDLHGRFDDLITSADSVKIFQALIDTTVPTQLTHVAPGTGINRHQLRDLMKNPLYGRDQDFTRHVDAEANALYGRTKIYD